MDRFSLAAALILAFPTLATAQGSEQYQTALTFYEAGEYQDALSLLAPLANSGDAAATNLLGFMYERGFGVAADPARAMDYYRRAADGGSALAMANLGVIYRDGLLDQAADGPAARDWFERAIAAGDVEARADLGFLYESGILGAPDMVAAEREYRLAAEAGVPLGMFNLGILYRTGEVVPVDFDIARQLFTDAAIAGYGGAVGELAIMMELGEGEPVDLDGAKVGYEAAMRMGHAESAFWAAWMFADNPGYFGDAVRGSAYCHYALARATAQEDAEWRPDCDRWFGTLSAADQAAAADLATRLP